MKDIILNMSAPLDVGQCTGHEICPRCNGGTSHERSLIVRKLPHGVWFKCFRATCGLSGFYRGTHGSIQFTQEFDNRFKPRNYTYDTCSLSEDQLLYFRRKYELNEAEISEQGIKYCPDRDSYVFPIYNYMGYEVGVVDRSFAGRKPKSITYWFQDVPKLHFPRGGVRSNTIIAVEDQLSSIKASRFLPSVALLGTSFSIETAMYLCTKYSNLVMALDADASARALKYEKEYSSLFKGNFSTLILSKDIKDTTHVQLQEILDGYID